MHSFYLQIRRVLRSPPALKVLNVWISDMGVVVYVSDMDSWSAVVACYGDYHKRTYRLLNLEYTMMYTIHRQNIFTSISRGKSHRVNTA